MKISPIAIQSYQQLNQNQKPADQASNSQEKLSEGVSKSAESRLTIRPAANETSRLAVKSSRGSYADLLSPQEKQALDLLFNRFRDSQRFGPAYRSEEQSQGDAENLGSLVDVKV